MGHRIALSVLSLMMLLSAPLATANAQVNPQVSLGTLQYPPISANALSAVVRGEYTSPQFDYTVTWSSSWDPDGEPISELGKHDELWLESDEGFAAYIGFFMSIDEEDLVDAWVTVVTDTHPEVEITQDYKSGSSRRALQLTYDDNGRSFTQSVAAVPLASGTSMLLIVHGQPTEMASRQRKNLEEGVTVILPSSAGGGVISGAGKLESAGSQPQVTTQQTISQPQVTIQQTVEVLPSDDQYTIRITCRNVTQSYGAWYGDCDSPFPITNYECIEDRSPIVAHGVMKLLCKLK